MKATWVACSLACLLLATGCVRSRNSDPARNHEIEIPEAWVFDTGPERLADRTLAVWWTQFEDPALTALVEEAFGANVDLQIAVERVQEASALRVVAAGGRLPSASGNAAVVHTRLSDAGGGAVGDRSFTFNSLGLDASWEIDLWGRIRQSIEAADANVQAALEGRRLVRALVAAQVAGSYLGIRELQLRQRFAEENVARQQETLKLTRDRFSAGLVPKLDVHQAELNLARTEAILPRLRQQHQAALRSLEVLTGRTPGTLAQRLEQEAEIPMPSDITLHEFPANVIRRRPDLRVAEQELLAAAARVGVAKADLYPRISLTGSFAFEARETGDLFDGNALATKFGPFLSVPIFQGGRLRAQVDAAESRALQAELRYRQLVLSSLEEVENSLSAFREEQIRGTTLQQGVQASSTAVLQVRSLYENGLVTFLNVLDAERSLAAVQDEAAASLGQSARNLVTVYRALGGGWELEER